MHVCRPIYVCAYECRHMHVCKCGFISLETSIRSCIKRNVDIFSHGQWQVSRLKQGTPTLLNTWFHTLCKSAIWYQWVVHWLC